MESSHRECVQRSWAMTVRFNNWRTQVLDLKSHASAIGTRAPETYQNNLGPPSLALKCASSGEVSP
jgi:hypothetical protein